MSARANTLRLKVRKEPGMFPRTKFYEVARRRKPLCSVIWPGASGMVAMSCMGKHWLSPAFYGARFGVVLCGVARRRKPLCSVSLAGSVRYGCYVLYGETLAVASVLRCSFRSGLKRGSTTARAVVFVGSGRGRQVWLLCLVWGNTGCRQRSTVLVWARS
jgi:hypothetical protein